MNKNMNKRFFAEFVALLSMKVNIIGDRNVALKSSRSILNQRRMMIQRSVPVY